MLACERDGGSKGQSWWMELRRWRLFGEASLAFSGRATPFFRVAYGAESGCPAPRQIKTGLTITPITPQLLFGSGAFDWRMVVALLKLACFSGFGIQSRFLLFHRSSEAESVTRIVPQLFFLLFFFLCLMCSRGNPDFTV